MQHYLDWLVMEQQGLPLYMTDPTCLGDFSFIADAPIYDYQNEEAQQDIQNLITFMQLLEIANMTQSNSTMNSLIDFITATDLPFDLTFMANYGLYYSPAIINYVNQTVIPALMDLIDGNQYAMDNVLHNPLYSTPIYTTGQDSVRYGHTY